MKNLFMFLISVFTLSNLASAEVLRDNSADFRCEGICRYTGKSGPLSSLDAGHGSTEGQARQNVLYNCLRMCNYTGFQGCGLISSTCIDRR